MVRVAPGWRLHHVGVAVPDVRAAAEPYTAAMEMIPLGAVVRDEVQRVDLLFLGDSGGGGIALELVAPYSEESPIAGHLLRGIGAYHSCYEVDDIATALVGLRDARFRILSEPVPAVAFGGRSIAWVVAPSRHLIELLEA